VIKKRRIISLQNGADDLDLLRDLVGDMVLIAVEALFYIWRTCIVAGVSQQGGYVSDISFHAAFMQPIAFLFSSKRSVRLQPPFLSSDQSSEGQPDKV